MMGHHDSIKQINLLVDYQFTNYQILTFNEDKKISLDKLLVTTTDLLNSVYNVISYDDIEEVKNSSTLNLLIDVLKQLHTSQKQLQYRKISYLIYGIYNHRILYNVTTESDLIDYIIKIINLLNLTGDEMSKNNDFDYLVKYGKLPHSITDENFKILLDEKDYIRNNILHYIFYDEDIPTLNKTLDFITTQTDGRKKLFNMLSSTNIGGNTPLSLIINKNILATILGKLNHIELGSIYSIKDKYGQNFLHFIAKSEDIKAKELFAIVTNSKQYNIHYLINKLLEFDNFGYTVIKRLKSQGNYHTLEYLKKTLPKTIISQVALLSANEQVEVARFVINDEDYNIICQQQDYIDEIAIVEKSIIVKKEDWSSINNKKLSNIINTIQLTGTKNNLKLIYNNRGISLNCNVSDPYTQDLYRCSDVRKMLSILDGVQKLGNIKNSSIAVAEIFINDVQYQIVCKEGTGGYKIVDKSIIIENTDWSNMTSKDLKERIARLPLSGTKTNLKILQNYKNNINILGFIEHYSFSETLNKLQISHFIKPLSILDAIHDLDNKIGASKEVAEIFINDVRYQIVCKEGTGGYKIANKSIIIENTDWRNISNFNLQKIIRDIHLTGVKHNPRITTNVEGIKLNCDSINSDIKPFISCDDINAPLSVLDEVQRLHNATRYTSKEVATVRIGVNKYNIVCEKGNNENVQIDSTTIKLIQNDWGNITNRQLQQKITDIQLTNIKQDPKIAEDNYGIKVFEFNQYYDFGETRKTAHLIDVSKSLSILDNLQSSDNLYGRPQNIAMVKIKNKNYYITCVQGNGVNKITNDSIVLKSLLWQNITNQVLQDRINKIKLTYINDTFMIARGDHSIQLDCSGINFDRITTVTNCTKNVIGSVIEKVRYLSDNEIEQIADIIIDGRIYNIIYELNKNPHVYSSIIDNAISIKGAEVHNEEQLSNIVEMFFIMKRGEKYSLRYNVKQKNSINFSLQIHCLPQIFSRYNIQKCTPDINFTPVSYWLFLIKNYNRIGVLSERILETIEEKTLQIVNTQQEINDTNILSLMTDLKFELNRYYLAGRYNAFKKDCLNKIDCNSSSSFFSKKTIGTLTPKTNTWLNWQSILKIKLPFEDNKEQRLTFYQSAKVNENIAIKNFIIGANLKEMTNNILTSNSVSSINIESNYFDLLSVTHDLRPIINPQPLLRLASHVCKNIEWIDYVEHSTKDNLLVEYNSLFSVKGGKLKCKSSNIWLNKEKYDFANTLNFVMNLEKFFKFLKQEEEVIPGVFFGAYNCHMHNECQDFVQEILKVTDHNLYGYDFGSSYGELEFIDF